ncbi:hypothetical protein HER10_EVM0003410 [Colletotrichum scovillei]|uniref:Uncharacterized protein n=1 Tax=Colletotrichum scovillei TaxID=1209932 RepID=A0A9P7RAF4_9PEZI|nr:uncharacterized protein HER10_EVM0003410 [Colletotrichum scovillei]KAF4776076.1 hypothetical protein HER10_EVM0003410 [Colletotrichum scovillei]KAG7053895.1 hypothetical protein JMJ77_0000973 [Colletotrichum scovillei]KAG7072191.1 hypothetical protein JMJ76_0005049 [Colletotrichum scovillei]KAG7080535.1 hypothetical protein JMJ78_0007628 [Colletotrichum scovillei]
MDSSAQARQVLIADLPREGDLAHHTNDGRPTTLVRTESNVVGDPNPNPNPSPDLRLNPEHSESELLSSVDVASLYAQVARLNDALAKLEDEVRRVPYVNSEKECRGAAGDVEQLLGSLAQRAGRKTGLERWFPCTGRKKRDLLRRHVCVVQETCETVGMTHLRVADAFAGLCRRADGLGEDVERLSQVVGEARDGFEWERARWKVLGWQEGILREELEGVEARMSAVSGESSSSGLVPDGNGDGIVDNEATTTTNEREATVAQMKFETEPMATLPLEMEDYAHNPIKDDLGSLVEQLQHLKDARNARSPENEMDEVRLEIMAASLESLFLLKHIDLSDDLQRRVGALTEGGKRCLAVAEGLEKLRDSNYNDLVVGLGELAKKPDAESRREGVKKVKTTGRLGASLRGVTTAEYLMMR